MILVPSSRYLVYNKDSRQTQGPSYEYESLSVVRMVCANFFPCVDQDIDLTRGYEWICVSPCTYVRLEYFEVHTTLVAVLCTMSTVITSFNSAHDIFYSGVLVPGVYIPGTLYLVLNCSHTTKNLCTRLRGYEVCTCTRLHGSTIINTIDFNLQPNHRTEILAVVCDSWRWVGMYGSVTEVNMMQK